MKNIRHHQHHKNGHKHSRASRFGARLTGIALAAVLATGMTGTAHAGDVVTYVHADHLGSPVAETNSLGQVTRNQVYSPYGETHFASDGDTAGFTGHRNDADTGLVYMQARYYDPISGRFLSTDPVTFSANKPDHFNRYWYAGGSPVVRVDPDGAADVIYYRAGERPGNRENSRFGHVAVRTENGTYVSKFPSGNPVNSTADFHTPEQDFQTYGEPDQVINVELPNEAAADEFAADLLADPENNQYRGLTANCADAVIDVVEAGGLDLGGTDGVDTPASVVEDLTVQPENEQPDQAANIQNRDLNAL